MKSQLIVFALINICAASMPLEAQPHEVTIGDLAEAVKSHAAEVSNTAPGGAYPIFYNNKKLELTLREVHDDRLAKVADGFYFICVDFKGSDGNTYDVDFYLAGPPGKMTVTQVGIHKINDLPLYDWKLQPNGTWIKMRPK